MNAKFSVIIPVYNKFPHLDRSIGSVLNQTNPDFELILIDDASTDGSSEKLLEFDDPRIKILKRAEPGPGGYAARNLGIMHASHPWICFLDADDEWELNVLETLSEVIQNDASVEILCWGWLNVEGNVKTLDAYSQKYSYEPIKQFTLTDFFNVPQPMWTGGISLKKELIDKAGGFPEHGFKRGGDMDTWIRCLYQSHKNLRITRPMTYYYLDSVNMVTKSVKKNISFSFSDFVMQILKNTNDKQLIKSIRYFQNRRIYTVLSERLKEGKSIDYNLMFKMNNRNLTFYFLAIKLHAKFLLIKANFFSRSKKNLVS